MSNSKRENAQKSPPKKIAVKTEQPKKSALIKNTTILEAPFTILKVQVSGGTTPFSIQVFLYKDGTQVLKFTASSSFTHLFSDLEEGFDYDIAIAGFNPAGGNTVCAVTTDHITLSSSSDKNPTDPLTGKAYLVDYSFTVK